MDIGWTLKQENHLKRQNTINVPLKNYPSWRCKVLQLPVFKSFPSLKRKLALKLFAQNLAQNQAYLKSFNETMWANFVELNQSSFDQLIPMYRSGGSDTKTYLSNFNFLFLFFIISTTFIKNKMIKNIICNLPPSSFDFILKVFFPSKIIRNYFQTNLSLEM